MTNSSEALDKSRKLLAMVLCGGRGSRMNGEDKGLVLFNQQPMASYPIKAFSGCGEIIINANRNQEQYSKHFRMTVLNDSNAADDKNHKQDNPEFLGPLAGMLAGLQYARDNHYQWLITAPCDAPFITSDYVKKMQQAAKNSTSKIFMANDGFRQPVFSLLHTDIIEPLAQFLKSSDSKKILVFYQEIGYEFVYFSDTKLFTNINSPKEKQKYSKI